MKDYLGILLAVVESMEHFTLENAAGLNSLRHFLFKDANEK
jgi:hypothetical protein